MRRQAEVVREGGDAGGRRRRAGWDEEQGQCGEANRGDAHKVEGVNGKWPTTGGQKGMPSRLRRV